MALQHSSEIKNAKIEPARQAALTCEWDFCGTIKELGLRRLATIVALYKKCDFPRDYQAKHLAAFPK